MIKKLSAIFVLLLALVLQLWFVPGGMRGDFVLATLIAFSFLFDLPELSVAILFSVFVLNPFAWPSIDMALLVLLPLMTYVMRRWFSLDIWTGGAVAIALGIFFYYLLVIPGPMFHAFGSLLLDMIAGVAFGEIVLYGMVFE